MSAIKNYLKIEYSGRNGMDLLYRFTKLGSLFSSDQILEYYVECSSTKFLVDDLTVSLGKVVRETKSILDALDDESYAFLRTAHFIDLCSLLEWEEKQACAMERLRTDGIHGTKSKIIPEFLESFWRHAENQVQNAVDGCLKLIYEDRDRCMVERGLLHPSLFDLHPDQLNLSCSTFRFSLYNNIDITKLMTYELSFEEAKILHQKVHTDAHFRRAVTKHLSDQGAHNTTMFVISKLCGLSQHPRNVNYRKIDGYFCLKHSEGIVRRFEDFSGSEKISKLEAYYLYLSAKSSIGEDAEEVRKVLGRVWGLLSEAEEDALLGILDIALEQKLDIPIRNIVIHLISFLEDRPYFSDLLSLKVVEMIERGVKLIRYKPYLDNIRRVLSFLQLTEKIHHDRSSHLPSTKTEEIASDALFTSQSACFFMSSGQQMVDEEDHDDDDDINSLCQENAALDDYDGRVLPLIEFKANRWLSEADKTRLLEEYSEHYDVSELAKNCIATEVVGEKARRVFVEKIGRIEDRVRRGMIMCKVNLEIIPGTLSTEEIRHICKKSSQLYSLWLVMMTEKIPEKYIKKFLASLSREEEECFVQSLNSRSYTQEVTEGFVLCYLRFMMKKYELSFFVDSIEKFMDKYPVSVTLLTQKYLIELIEDGYFIDAYIGLVERLYKRMISLKAASVVKGNETLLTMLINYAKLRDKEIFVGNIRQGKT